MDIHSWMQNATVALTDAFCQNVQFIGLRGSYRRGTATYKSGIDMVVIFHDMDFRTLQVLHQVLCELPFGHLAQAFTASARDLMNWPRHELPVLYADTAAYYGSLEPLLPDLHHEDIVTGARASAAALHQRLSTAIASGTAPDMVDVDKHAYFTSVLHGAAVRGTFDWNQPRPQMSAEQTLRWLSRVLDEL